MGLLRSAVFKAGLLKNPFLSKILKKVVARKLCEYLWSNRRIVDFECRFRGDHSTETALVKVAHDLLTASAKGLMSVLVLFDLRAAFETVDHHIFWLRVVKLLGIKDSVLNWLTSYLSDRCLFGHLNYDSCVPTKIYHGVPQGSVFGQILFILYILLLCSTMRKPSVNLNSYTDDT